MIRCRGLYGTVITKSTAIRVSNHRVPASSLPRPSFRYNDAIASTTRLQISSSSRFGKGSVWYNPLLRLHHHPHHHHPHQTISVRNYVFLPSSISEITKSLKEAIQTVKRKKDKLRKRFPRIQTRFPPPSVPPSPSPSPSSLSHKKRPRRPNLIVPRFFLRSSKPKPKPKPSSPSSPSSPQSLLRHRYKITQQTFQSWKALQRHKFLRRHQRYLQWKQHTSDTLSLRRHILRLRYQLLLQRIGTMVSSRSEKGRRALIRRFRTVRDGRYLSWFLGKPRLRTRLPLASRLHPFFPRSNYAISLTEPYRMDWFTPMEGYPRTSVDPRSGRYVNPWRSISTDGWKTLGEVWEWKWNRFWSSITDKDRTMNAADATTYTRKEKGETEETEKDRNNRYLTNAPIEPSPVTHPTSPNNLKLTWIGHATVLVQFSNAFSILTDPVFSHKASPFQILRNYEFFGVPRIQPPLVSPLDRDDDHNNNHHNSAGKGEDNTTNQHALWTPLDNSRKIDVCLISHDHYDHLDENSVKALIECNTVSYWVVPKGHKVWLMDKCGVDEDRIVELEWWEDVKFRKTMGSGSGDDGTTIGEMEMVVVDNDQQQQQQTLSSSSSSFEKDQRGDGTGGYTGGDTSSTTTTQTHEMVVTCAPSQHWCGRSPFDRNQRLWCSFAVHATSNTSSTTSNTSSSSSTNTTTTNNNNNNTGTPSSSSSTPPPLSSPTQQTYSFYYAGDTGYPQTFPLHRQIGDRLGPFDLAAIPIGAYKPRFFMWDSHCDPYEAVKIHRDIKSRKSVAVHWGTFPLADEPFDEPPRLLYDAVMTTRDGGGGDDDNDIGADKMGKEEMDVGVVNERGGSGSGSGSSKRERNEKVDFVAIPHGSYIEAKAGSNNRSW